MVEIETWLIWIYIICFFSCLLCRSSCTIKQDWNHLKIAWICFSCKIFVFQMLRIIYTWEGRKHVCWSYRILVYFATLDMSVFINTFCKIIDKHNSSLILGRISSGTASRISFAVSCFGCSGCCGDVEKEWSLLDKSGTHFALSSDDLNDLDLSGVCKCFSVVFLMVVQGRERLWMLLLQKFTKFLDGNVDDLFHHYSFRKKHGTCL